jgi:hypothetical protein
VSPAEISCRLSDLNHLICPTSEFREFVSSRRAKIFRFRFPRIMIIVTKSRLDKRGRTRRHEREAGCDGRRRYRLTSDIAADSGGVWSWHPWAGAKFAGDGLQATVTMRSRTPGRARTTPLTPLRREGRVAPVEPVVNNSCAFYNAHEAAGATSIRSSLRPLFSEGLSCKTRARCAARVHRHG